MTTENQVQLFRQKILEATHFLYKGGSFPTGERFKELGILRWQVELVFGGFRKLRSIFETDKKTKVSNAAVGLLLEDNSNKGGMSA